MNFVSCPSSMSTVSSAPNPSSFTQKLFNFVSVMAYVVVSASSHKKYHVSAIQYTLYNNLQHFALKIIGWLLKNDYKNENYWFNYFKCHLNGYSTSQSRAISVGRNPPTTYSLFTFESPHVFLSRPLYWLQRTLQCLIWSLANKVLPDEEQRRVIHLTVYL